MAQKQGNARNILVGASPLFITNVGSTSDKYEENLEPGVAYPASPATATVPAFTSGTSYIDTLNGVESGDIYYRNVGFTNNGLQITYNPTYDSVTVDQLLDTAKLFKSAMEVMVATEMSEGTLENVLVVFGQPNDGSSTIDADNTWVKNSGTGLAQVDILGLQAGALGAAPVERQLIAVGQAPTADETGANITRTERIYYGRRVLSVQQSQFSLARTTATTFPVTFRLLPDVNKPGEEYGKIIDRVLVA
jgi:hypothetical protein